MTLSDAFVMAAKELVRVSLGPEFLESQPFNLKKVLDDSTASTPIIFLLSTGTGNYYVDM